MDLLLAGIQLVALIGVIICCIILGVRMIQAGSVVLGIVTMLTCFLLIGNVIPLVWGWKRAEAGEFKTTVTVYSLLFILPVVSSIIGFFTGT